MHGGRHPDGEERLLTQDEIATVNANMFCLKNLIKPQQRKLNFLDHLLAKKCISVIHKESIESLPENQNHERTEKLLNILKRRSYRDFKNFKLCLEETHQNKIVDILEKEGIVTVCVKFEDHYKHNMHISESKLVDVLTRQLPSFYLNAERIDLIGNCVWKSDIMVFFQCHSIVSYSQLIRFHRIGVLEKN